MGGFANVIQWHDWWWLWAVEHCLARYVFSLTSIVSNNISLTVFTISDAEVQGHRRSKVTVSIESPLVTSQTYSLTANYLT